MATASAIIPSQRGLGTASENSRCRGRGDVAHQPISSSFSCSRSSLCYFLGFCPCLSRA